jgi:hypothetical protein
MGCLWVVFGIPHQIWKILEGGLIKNFYVKEAKSAIIAAQPEELGDLVNRFTTYFRSLLGQNNKYFMWFCICEILNLVAVTINFILNDKFLDGKFKSYGPDVLNYHSLELKSDDRNKTINPMCDAFPTKVNCVLKSVGLSGTKQVYYYNYYYTSDFKQFRIFIKKNLWIFQKGWFMDKTLPQ